MKINLKTTNFSLTEAIENYLRERLAPLEKLVHKTEAKGETLAEVELGRTTHHRHGEIFRAEINLRLAGGGNLRTVSEQESLYAAIDLMKDGMLEEVRAWQKKHQQLLRRGGRAFKNIIRGLNPWKK
jgi:ribosomal subunit interface protein